MEAHTASTSPYTLSISLSALDHLGIKLYSNAAAVISEVVANAYDADASEVRIDIDNKLKRILITDDGIGMTIDDINGKFLNVGYSKRDVEGSISGKGRNFMGRKGIGKLSVFSIANVIEVHSVKDDQKHGFILNAHEIEAMASNNKSINQIYKPTPVDPKNISIKNGTMIVLSDLKKGTQKLSYGLKQNIARRFTIIGSGFNVLVDGTKVTYDDRNYFDKLEFIWYLGEESKKYAVQCKNLSDKEKIKLENKINNQIENKDGQINTIDSVLTGWIGTVKEQKQIDEDSNSIVVFSNGRLFQEDILKDLKEAGVYASYIMGEIEAPFLDDSNYEDIATSDRQRLKESDDRTDHLKKFIQTKILKNIQSQWTDLRNQKGEKEALQNPQIEKWFNSLTKENKKVAVKMFGKINQMPIKDPNTKKEILKSGILAFESVAAIHSLDKLNAIVE